MPLILTLVINLATFAMLLFRIIRGDQIIYIITTMLQTLFFIDMVAILLLHPKKGRALATNASGTETRSRRKPRGQRRINLIVFWSTIISLVLFVFYLVSSILIFF